MRVFLLGLTFSICSMSQLSAQRIFFNVSAGLANYQGELNTSYYTLKQAHGAFGLGLGYEVSDRFMLRGALTIAGVGAHDKHGKYAYRNLSFTSGIKEASLTMEFNLRDPYTHQITPFVFAGIAAYHFNPYSYDSTGKKVYLQPLSTEGQGFVKNRDFYKLNQFSLPLGGGIKFNINENFRMGLETGFRKTFNDYLDDVSTTYVDEALLLANRGPLAVSMAYRGDDVKQGTYPAGGALRGSATKAKDWYYFSTVTASFRMGAGGGGRNGGRGKLGCPTNF